MAVGLLEKIANFIMPIEEMIEPRENHSVIPTRSKATHLRVHENADGLRMVVVTPAKYEDVCSYANHLKANTSVVVNFKNVDAASKQSMSDFLDGVCYVVGGSAERISGDIKLFVPSDVSINKELYGYSIPTYVKQQEV